MARKVANGVNKKQPTRRADHLNSSSESESPRGPIREFLRSRPIKTMAAGIGTAILSRLATNMTEKYPELARFLKENIESFEGKFGLKHSATSGEIKETHA